MAKKVSENNILSITEDWGLDTSNNLPYSGAAVLKFIKDTFDTKVGYFHYDVTTNRYLVFANEAKKDEYLENPTLTELVLGSFDAPFNYEATVTLFTPQYNAVFFGSTGNYLDFTFDIKNKAGASTGENVTITYTFIRNATKKVITETRRYGESVHFNIDDYLLEGTNTIIIGVSGQTTLAATTVALTYNVVNLQYSDEMDISKVYDLSQGTYTMEVFFNVSGYGTKIVEWFLDGNKLDFVKSEDEVVDVTSQRIKYIELSNLTSGIHTIQSRAYTLVNGEKFYTDTLYREIMVNNGDSTANIVAVAANVPYSHGIVTESNPFLFYGVEQYIPYEIRFATRKTGNVSIYLGNEPIVTLVSSANIESHYSITSNKSGTLHIKFVVDNIEREIPLSVNQTSLHIEEITASLSFDFRATGKSNTSIDKDIWSYGDYTATFEGFNWNASSGWVDNSLLINNGASFSVDISPLAKDGTSTGKTLEFEFSTRNVENDDAIICDLTTNGKGLLITASEARLTSAAGETVSTRFKAGEVNRIAFVINRKTGVTYKGLVFIYVNGILSGAVNYGSADNFTSTKQLTFVGTEEAQVELRAMRFYDTALSADNILNNYVIYRDTLNEMMEVYYRNEIYAEGTQSFSPDAMLHRLPVMVITGDVPTLEAATSTSTQILVDIDYTNEQDPTKNFKMKNAALRIQGTSSLAYPRKNFRFYTQKEESTLVYDADGKIIQNKLYSFKDGAQPVDCWCLKADFAESSGTHNTAIARLWNKAMYGAIIQHKNVLGEEVNGYALRTNAQIAALNAGYEYDVRTTIDGFPIVLFYKKNANDTDLIFLGKYNFNNDKSTPSVFGFENIPDFDNSHMQCWETKDNGHPLGLFTDISNFDADWSEAFESRYPDTKTPNTADLKAFSIWMNGVSQSDFTTQKWAHFDVYKVAAYYCYLMRFGAVDQPVKNAFITSEDGEKFYFINYDNDTINGLINTGRLALDPTVDRDTIGSDGEYVYAGHNSVLWNRFTNDSEFMEIVSIVDNALYSAGLRYDEVIAEFNDGQADKWVERVYNQDAEYKYLLPYVNQATNNLFMLQGARSSHRSWWLSKRFSLYDSLFLSGAYRDRNISFKCLNDTQPNQEFTITAATKMNYGYGVNNGIRETGIEVDKGGTHTFVTTDTLNLGDVVKVFASANFEALDLSKLADRLAVLDCSAAADPSLGTKMKRLILGGAGKVNTELAAISGINVLTSLQELNVEGYQNMTTLDLTAQKDLHKVFAKGSSVASIDFAAGAPVEHLELPSAMMALNFNQLSYLNLDGITSENNFESIRTIAIYDCPNLSNNFQFIKEWLNEKTTPDSECSIAMNNINWNVSYEEFIEFSQRKSTLNLDLKGSVHLSSMTLDQANELMLIWGEDCFDKTAEFRITAPDAIYINPDNVTLLEGESIKFSYLLFSSTDGTIRYKIISGSRTGVSLNEQTGEFTTVENGTADATIYVRVIYTAISGEITYSTATVTVKKRIYPTSSNIKITGASTVSTDETYTWSSTSTNITGDMSAEWELTGSAVDNGYVSLNEQEDGSCIVNFIKGAEPNQTVNATIKVTLKKKVDNSVVATKTMTIKMVNYVYPATNNTVLEGETTPSTDNPVYTWQSSVTGTVGPINVEYYLDDILLPYWEIKTTEWDSENPLYGSCTLQKIEDVDYYVRGNINVKITRVNTGETITLSKELMILNPSVIMTDTTNKPVLTAMYNAGLASNSTYMTKAEAEAVTDGMFNSAGTQSGSIFYNNTSITQFDELRHFTSLTKLDPYCFYGCTKLTSLKIPSNIRNFGKYCCYRGSSSYSLLTIDQINVETIESYAFTGYQQNKLLKINVVNWYCEENYSSSRTNLFYNANVDTLNIYVDTKTNNTSYGSQNPFYYTYVNNAIIHEGVTKISQCLFYASYLSNIEIADSVTILEQYGISNVSNKICNINKFSKNIETIGLAGMQYVNFNCDVAFNNLNFGLSRGSISYALYFGVIDLSGNNHTSTTFYLDILFASLKYGNKLILPNRVLSYVDGNLLKSGIIDEVYIPNMDAFVNSTFEYYNPAMLAKELYAMDVTTEKYKSLRNFNTSDWMITKIPSYMFHDCKCIDVLDASSVIVFGEYCFNGASLQKIIIDSHDGTGEIKMLAFSCGYNYILEEQIKIDKLQYIVDTSYAPWKTLNVDAFSNRVNAQINSNVFGLFRTYGKSHYTNPMTNLTATLPLGDYTFKSTSGSYFDNGENTKTITLTKTGSVEDLTDQLAYKYMDIEIVSNKGDALFNVNFIDTDLNEKSIIVPVGITKINVSQNSSITVSGNTEYEGYATPNGSISVDLSPYPNATIKITLDYVEQIDIFVLHKNNNYYKQSEWSSNGYSNDDAAGILVMNYWRGGYIISKEDMSGLTWGGYGTTVLNTKTINSSDREFDYDGFHNTVEIIEQLLDVTYNNITGAPIAEYCANYEFGNGSTGYLPAFSEMQEALLNAKKINECLNLCGGSSLSYSTTSSISNNHYYVTSTQRGSAESTRKTSIYAACVYTSSNNLKKSTASISKTDTIYKFRTFGAYGMLNIESNLNTNFIVEYTNIYGVKNTKTVKNGFNSINVKYNTTVTITPESIGIYSVEPQSFTFSEHVHNVSFVFEKGAGVYIQNVDGKLYTSEEWSNNTFANESANGVAVLSMDGYNFVIAKGRLSSSLWGPSYDIPELTNGYSDASVLDGSKNTDVIVKFAKENYPSSTFAARLCREYTFPNGKFGYMPSVMEAVVTSRNINEINNCMNKIGGKTIGRSQRCSNETGADYAYYVSMTSGSISNSRKYYSDSSEYATRPYCKI